MEEHVFNKHKNYFNHFHCKQHNSVSTFTFKTCTGHLTTLFTQIEIISSLIKCIKLPWSVHSTHLAKWFLRKRTKPRTRGNKLSVFKKNHTSNITSNFSKPLILTFQINYFKLILIINFSNFKKSHVVTNTQEMPAMRKIDAQTAVKLYHPIWPQHQYIMKRAIDLQWLQVTTLI